MIIALSPGSSRVVAFLEVSVGSVGARLSTFALPCQQLRQQHAGPREQRDGPRRPLVFVAGQHQSWRERATGLVDLLPGDEDAKGEYTTKARRGQDGWMAELVGSEWRGRC